MRATEQYSPVVLFIMLYKVVPTFDSADEILKCDQMKATEQHFPVVLFVSRYLQKVNLVCFFSLLAASIDSNSHALNSF